MSKTTKTSPTKSPGGTGRIVGLAILVIVFGIAIWARNHFTANAASFNQYMDGVRSMQAGRQQEAIATWEDLVVKDPTFPDAYAALATYYNDQGESQHSLELLQKAQDQHLETPDITLSLAETYARLNDKRAMAEGKLAVAVKPNDYRSHLALATAYAQAFDEPHAIQELHTAQQLAPTNPILFLLGAEYTATVNDYTHVESQARTAIGIAPNLAEGWYYVGWAIASGPSTDRLPEARTALEKSSQINPNSPSTWLELGEVDWKLHDVPSALSALEKAHTLGAKAPQGGVETQQHLQDRVKTAHLLLEVYHSRGMATEEAKMRTESDQLSTQIQALTHSAGARTGQ